MSKEETNRIEKEMEKIGKSKDDSSRMFKAIKDLIKLKLKTPLLLKKRDQYTTNQKQQVQLIAKHYQKVFNKVDHHYWEYHKHLRRQHLQVEKYKQ